MERHLPLTPLAAIERLARRLPLGPGLWLADRLGRAYCRLALSAGWSLDPWRVRDFPAELEALLGEEADSATNRRLVEDRLAFALTEWLLRRGLRQRRAPAVRDSLVRVAVRGEEYLQGALDRGRGAVLVSAHFGFPHLIGRVLDGMRVPWVAVADAPWRASHIRAAGDRWAHTRMLHRLREELGHNHLCVWLVDRPRGARTRTPFLRTHLDLAVAAFHLAERSHATLVPFFLTSWERPPRFLLEFAPALSLSPTAGGSPTDGAAREFSMLYASYVRRHPALLPYLASSGVAGGQPRAEKGVEPADRSEDLG